jgi:hypothetical protein
MPCPPDENLQSHQVVGFEALLVRSIPDPYIFLFSNTLIYSIGRRSSIAKSLHEYVILTFFIIFKPELSSKPQPYVF